MSSSAKGVNPTVVKEFIKSAQRAYIPGSSLKGSILSGVIEAISAQKRIFKQDYYAHLSDVLNELARGLPDRDTNMGRLTHWLDVRDSNFIPAEKSLEIVQVKVMGARRGQLPILYEVLKENFEFETEIISRSNKTEKEILQMADSFYRKVYNKEREYAQRIRQELPPLSLNSFLLRLGQGSTAWSTSFLILASELGINNYTIQRPKFHKIKCSPRTRKLISGTKSMGWIEIKIIG
ncbi:MAG: type III-A CRISPR-associated RAMP protein Csm5 [Candidatus Omnitrophica bacterium]|nr:type III-A CRISPR-associated RAMP protein Csm5 [Candidatus Omnitrophota bacterium]